MTAATSDGAGIAGLLRQHRLGKPARYARGSVLYWQGDPVDHVFFLQSGAVKVSTISEDGQIHTYGIVGAGRLLGANDYFLGGEHERVAEAFEDSEVLVMPPAEFERALSQDACLSAVVMRELARGLHGLSEQMRDLSFLDVQQRLKRSLVRLAEEHGLATDRGIRINLAITHEEIGALVAANRSTITACLSELKKQGYLWTEGRRLVIIPPEQMDILDHLSEAVADGDDDGALLWAQRAGRAGVEPLKALSALTRGMKQVDRSYSRSEIDLPDVVLAAFAMKNALPSIEARMGPEGQEVPAVGTVAIGTVHGDIHDIGKTIVAMLLKARGFGVIDLGVNVATEQFLEPVRTLAPDILAMSALTTATAPEITKVSRALEREGLRDSVKLLVGGGAVTPALAERVGADGYHATARGAVEQAWRLCTWE